MNKLTGMGQLVEVIPFSHPSATIYESVERKQVLLDCTLLMALQLKWLPKKKILVLQSQKILPGTII